MRLNPEQRVAWYDLLCAHVNSFMAPKPLDNYVLMQEPEGY